MRIVIPIVIDINDDEIEAMADCCGVSVERYRKGLVEDKKICLGDALYEYDDKGVTGFKIDHSRIEVR